MKQQKISEQEAVAVNSASPAIAGIDDNPPITKSKKKKLIPFKMFVRNQKA